MRPRECTGKINAHSSSSFFLCKTFRLRSSLEINWHGFTRCSNAAIIYEGPVHFKSLQLWQSTAIHGPFWTTTIPLVPGPHLTASPISHFEAGFRGGLHIYQHPSSDMGTRSAWRSQAAARSSSVPMCPLSAEQRQRSGSLQSCALGTPHWLPPLPVHSQSAGPHIQPGPANPPSFSRSLCKVWGFHLAGLWSN